MRRAELPTAPPQNSASANAPAPGLLPLACLRPFSQSLPPHPRSLIHLSTLEPPGTNATAPLSSVGLGVLLFLFIKGDFEWPCTTERVPPPQKTCAFILKSHCSPGNDLDGRGGKKEKGFSNNLSKSTQNFIDSAQTIVYSGTLLCVYVCNHWTIPSYIRLAMCS